MHISMSHWLAVPQAERTLRAWRGPCSDLHLLSQLQAPPGLCGAPRVQAMEMEQLQMHMKDSAQSSLQRECESTLKDVGQWTPCVHHTRSVVQAT